MQLPFIKTSEKRWEKALRDFERCRVTSGYSVASIFTALNPRGTDTLPVQEFAENMSIYCHINLRDALALAKTFDVRRRQCVGAEDIAKFLSKQSGLTNINSLLKDHPLFPEWLVTRGDFQNYFSEWAAEDGAPNTALLESALRLGPNKRKAGDLQVIYKWIKLHKCLVHVRDSRLLDVCQSMQFMECPSAGIHIVEQGDTGDAFYILIDGVLNVSIDGTCVGSMTSGMSFGEKALENNAPRAATVTTVRPCRLMVLRAFEYKNLIASAQAKMNSEVVEFLHSRCPFFCKVSHARLYYMVKLMIRRTFQPGEKIQSQGEEAGCICVVMSGKVAITKLIQKEVIHDFRGRLHVVNGDACSGSIYASNHAPPSQNANKDDPSQEHILSSNTLEAHTTLVHIADVNAGHIFGDEAAAKIPRPYSYGAAAKSRTEIVFINRKEILEYFRERILRPQLLIQYTIAFHEDDESLIQNHLIHLKKHQYFEELKNAALTPQYAEKVGKLQDSRSLSTKCLESHQAAERGIQERIKYQRVAITATLDVQTKVAAPLTKAPRRASCIMFLAQKQS